MELLIERHELLHEGRRLLETPLLGMGPVSGLERVTLSRLQISW